MAIMKTGGNLPPLEQKVMTTGGNLPPEQMATTSAPTTGGNLPPEPAPATGIRSAVNTVQGALDGLLNNNGAYMQNARQTGLDMARQRGLLNSSIAAGNSQREAIRAAQPLVNNALDIFNRREGQDFTLNSMTHGANLAETMAQNNHVRQLAVNKDQAGLANWLANESYTRQFNGNLSMLPILNSFQLNNMVAQLAITDPEAYPPSVVSGITNFLNQNMFSILKEYFPNLIKPAGGT